MDTAKPAD